MHETGLAEAIIETLRKVQAARSEAIRLVRLQVGEFSGITPEHLAEHFYEAAEGTEFEGVKLETEVRGIMAKCEACEAVFELTQDTESCPKCASGNMSVQADEGVKLVSVE
ncbi:MAG: hydrogenase maturation nickel metallochaperone HypA [Armatimonadetes bacterium]|nr:hydrogenase maturation nickel metallochaperone HypA [Armatimonadota bacterium]